MMPGMLCLLIAGALPLVGVGIGFVMFLKAWQKVEGPESKKYKAFGCMVVTVAFYAVITTAILNAQDQVWVNGALAGAIIEGSASFVTAIGLGYVAMKGIEACSVQPKLFVGVILIMVFVSAQALYGLIAALVAIAKAKNSGDATYDEATGLGLCCALGFSGSVLAVVVAGTKALEISTEMPQTFMNNFLPALRGGSIGIIVLVNGVMTKGNFQSYVFSGFGFLCGGVLIAFAAQSAASTSGQRASTPVVAVGLGCAFVGLVVDVAMGNDKSNYLPLDGTTPAPDEQLELLGRATAALPVSVAAGALYVAVALGLVAAMRRRSQAPTESALPLLQ